MNVRIASLRAAAAAGLYELRRFADDSGASLIEYGIIVALVSVVSIVALSLVGQNATSSLGSAGASITP